MVFVVCDLHYSKRKSEYLTLYTVVLLILWSTKNKEKIVLKGVIFNILLVYQWFCNLYFFSRNSYLNSFKFLWRYLHKIQITYLTICRHRYNFVSTFFNLSYEKCTRKHYWRRWKEYRVSKSITGVKSRNDSKSLSVIVYE